jgi:hypothetical protein
VKESDPWNPPFRRCTKSDGDSMMRELTTSTLWATVVLELVVDAKPNGVVRVGGESGATDKTFWELVELVHSSSAQVQGEASSRCLADMSTPEPAFRQQRLAMGGKPDTTHKRVDRDGLLDGAETGHLDRVHVEYVDTLELSEQLESLQTGSLLFTASNTS